MHYGWQKMPTTYKVNGKVEISRSHNSRKTATIGFKLRQLLNSIIENIMVWKLDPSYQIEIFIHGQPKSCIHTVRMGSLTMQQVCTYEVVYACIDPLPVYIMVSTLSPPLPYGDGYAGPLRCLPLMLPGSTAHHHIAIPQLVSSLFRQPRATPPKQPNSVTLMQYRI